MSKPPSDHGVAIICGTGINAHTVLRNLVRIQWRGKIVLLRDRSEGPGFAGCVNPGIEQWAVTINHPDELPGLIAARVGIQAPVTLFFTDERYHPAFNEWSKHHPRSPLRFYLGSTTQMTCVLDRYLFCRFIAERDLARVPRTIAGEEDPFAQFGPDFIVRPRYSWCGVAQRERVKLVRGQEQFRAALADYATRGLTVAHLCFQELLSIRNEDNVSVSGWYAPMTLHLYCSRKVLQYPPGVGGGDLVELIPVPDGVMEQAKAILAALAYEGPFEMEFVFDTQAQAFKVTELNPRFWLQHGLIEAVSGCALVNTYLGRQPLVTTAADRALRFWVNPLYSVYRAFKLDFRSLRCWASRSSWAPFTLGEALRYAGHYAKDMFSV